MAFNVESISKPNAIESDFIFMAWQVYAGGVRVDQSGALVFGPNKIVLVLLFALWTNDQCG